MGDNNIKKIETTLLLFIRNGHIMLARKKRGFGAGKYNGVGGKLKGDETPEKAMIRECNEEVGVVPIDFEKVGIIDFIEPSENSGEMVNMFFHLYVASEWAGTLVETEEMQPHWFKINEIPYDQMFEDDTYWMPHVLQGNKFDAHFEFDENWNLVVKKIIFKDEALLTRKK